MEMDIDIIKNKENIIDIRSSTDFKDGHITNSKNISRIKLMDNPNNYLNKKDEYYLICDKGIISLYCSKILRALGFNCYSIKGGFTSVKDKNMEESK